MRSTMEKTLALIKPDAMLAGSCREILRMIEVNEFTILKSKELQLTPCLAGQFYAEHKGKQFFKKLMSFMCSGPTMAMVLARKDAIVQWRRLMGPTNSIIAKQEAPHSIRSHFGTDGTFNAVHGSDSFQSARREIRFFFPEMIADMPILGDVEMASYIQTSKTSLMGNLKTILLDGLTVLAKEKPTSNTLEALNILGKWLIENNPNAPKRDDLFIECPRLDLQKDDWIVDDKDLKESAECQGHISKIQESLTETEAAVKVQSVYRGYRVRKNVAV